MDYRASFTVHNRVLRHDPIVNQPSVFIRVRTIDDRVYDLLVTDSATGMAELHVIATPSTPFMRATIILATEGAHLVCEEPTERSLALSLLFENNDCFCDAVCQAIRQLSDYRLYQARLEDISAGCNMVAVPL